MELQTIVSRELDPLEPGVVSITRFHGGETFNVIPSSVRMSGTIRALTTEVTDFLKRRVVEVSEAVAKANRCEAEVTFPPSAYPPTVNDASLWQFARDVATDMLAEDDG